MLIIRLISFIYVSSYGFSQVAPSLKPRPAQSKNIEELIVESTEPDSQNKSSNRFFKTRSVSPGKSIPVYLSSSANTPNGETIAVPDDVTVSVIETHGTRAKITWSDGKLNFTRWIELENLTSLTPKVSVIDTAAGVPTCFDCETRYGNLALKNITQSKDDILNEIQNLQQKNLLCQTELMSRTLKSYQEIYKNRCNARPLKPMSEEENLQSYLRFTKLFNQSVQSLQQALALTRRTNAILSCEKQEPLVSDAQKLVEECLIDGSLFDEIIKQIEKSNKVVEEVLLRSDPERSFTQGVLCNDTEVKVTSHVGWRFHPENKKLKFHSGVDIAPRDKSESCAIIPTQGAEVVEYVTGCPRTFGWKRSRVLALDEKCHSGYGNYIIFRNPVRGTYTLYAHLDKCSDQIIADNAVEDVTTVLPWDNPDLAVGVKLTQGSIVGCVGNSGRSQAPHLHIEEYTEKDFPKRYKSNKYALQPIRPHDALVLLDGAPVRFPPKAKKKK